jgi:superfamily I DNA/RNA helicase
VLARTNRELVPYAAVALELGLPYRVEDDRLHWPDERATAALAGVDPDAPLLVGVSRAAAQVGLTPSQTTDLLAWAAACRDLDALRATIDARRTANEELRRDDANLTFATAHGTKGLEWDHVACIGHDEGAFPSGRALLEADDPVRVLEEERRLAYVAWTRARRTLTIVYDPGAPSRFVLEAFDPAELP